MINNRQNGRRRGRGGNGGGNNGQRGGNPGRPDSGNRIDNRARGNANQLYEKYKNLARDAQMSGDRVNTEYYLQFADHYFRVLSESRARFEEQNPNAAPQRRIQPVDSFDDFDGDEEYGDEGEPIRANEQGDGRVQQGGGNRDGRDARDGNRDPARDRGRDQQRFQASRDDGRRDDNRREDSRRDEGRRYEGQNAQRAEAGERGQDERGDRYAVTGSPVANDLGEDSPDGTEPTPIAPRRRGRPRREAVAEADAVPAAFDADRLPPSLSLANPPVDEAGEAEEPAKPRRRRVRSAGGEATQAG